MPYAMTMGLHVVEPTRYAQYRQEMSPLLEAAGGRFAYDFEVSRVLRSEAKHEINRVFVIVFPDSESKERFFADAVYREIRERLFLPAVGGATVLSEASQEPPGKLGTR